VAVVAETALLVELVVQEDSAQTFLDKHRGVEHLLKHPYLLLLQLTTQLQSALVAQTTTALEVIQCFLQLQALAVGVAVAFTTMLLLVVVVVVVTDLLALAFPRAQELLVKVLQVVPLVTLLAVQVVEQVVLVEMEPIMEMHLALQGQEFQATLLGQM
jgi:hypothetical protein